MENKRTRTKNFNPCEKQLLLRILVQYKNILENRQTTKSVNKQKDEAWTEISHEFNGRTTASIFRTPEQLKTLWENCRREMRDQFADVEAEQEPMIIFQKTEQPHVSDNESIISDISDKSWLVDDPMLADPLTAANLERLMVGKSKLSPHEMPLKKIKLMDPSTFETPPSAQTKKQLENEEVLFQLRKQILEEQRLHNRELQVLEIKLARERLENERMVAAKRVEMMKLKISKETIIK